MGNSAQKLGILAQEPGVMSRDITAQKPGKLAQVLENSASVTRPYAAADAPAGGAATSTPAFGSLRAPPRSPAGSSPRRSAGARAHALRRSRLRGHRRARTSSR